MAHPMKALARDNNPKWMKRMADGGDVTDAQRSAGYDYLKSNMRSRDADYQIKDNKLKSQNIDAFVPRDYKRPD